jgi:hypothetical protein
VAAAANRGFLASKLRTSDSIPRAPASCPVMDPHGAATVHRSGGKVNEGELAWWQRSRSVGHNSGRQVIARKRDSPTTSTGNAHIHRSRPPRSLLKAARTIKDAPELRVK